MENKQEPAAYERFISSEELWMNIIGSSQRSYTFEERIMKAVFSGVSGVMKLKRVLVAAICSVGLAAMGPHILLLILLVEGFDIPDEIFGAALILLFSMALPVLLTGLGALICHCSAKRNGETMGVGGAVLTQIAAVIGAVLLVAVNVLYTDVWFAITSAVIFAMWLCVFFSARAVRRAVTLGEPLRMPVFTAILCFVMLIFQIFMLAVFVFGEGFLLIERIGMGTASLMGIVASFSYELLVHKYNAAIALPRSRKRRAKDNAEMKNPLYVIADGSEK